MFKFTQSITVKAAIVGVLALLMLIPLMQVRSLIYERNAARATAIEKISAGWGGVQTVGGPVLTISSQEMLEDSNKKPYAVEHVEAILPDTLKITSQLEVEMRHYGIYEVPLYVAKIQLSG